ncbi:MAG: hypothetical protein ACRD0P_38030, partial [Stackebrandtia sp.]
VLHQRNSEIGEFQSIQFGFVVFQTTIWTVHRLQTSRVRSRSPPLVNATTTQPASTPDPAHGPVGPVDGSVAWTASPAFDGATDLMAS